MAVALLEPDGPLQGEIRVPGDKSIAHRALILAALAEGVSRVGNLPPGADVKSTAACLSALGVQVAPVVAPSRGVARRGRPDRSGPRGGCEVTVIPPRGGLRPPAGPLDCGNSGTTMRLLAGVLAGQPFRTTLTGDGSLLRRPMSRVAEPLGRTGATASAAGAGGTAPLEIRGLVPPRPLRAVSHRMTVASAQVKSCLLLAGLHASGSTTVIEPWPSRDHTERLLAACGVRVDGGHGPEGERRWTVESDGRPRLSPLDLDLPGDFSSSAFWIVAALLVPGSQLRLPAVGVNPTRTGLLRVLDRMGAGPGLTLEPCRRTCGGEPVADLEVRYLEGGLRGTVVTAGEVPSLIDEVPILAVAATQARGRTAFCGVGELRAKETDRLAALSSELGRMGAEIVLDHDRLMVDGPVELRPARVSTWGDHRMAMALAVASLLAQGRRATEIVGVECARVSYPGFFDDLEVVRP